MDLKNNWSNPTLACQRPDNHEQKRKQKMAKSCKKGVSEKTSGQAKPLAFQRSCFENRAEAPPASRQKQKKGGGRTTSTTGKQEGQTGLQEAGGADRQPEDQREGGEEGTDNTTRGGGTDNQAGGMEDRRPNRTRGFGTKLAGRGLGRCWFFVFVWL